MLAFKRPEAVKASNGVFIHGNETQPTHVSQLSHSCLTAVKKLSHRCYCPICQLAVQDVDGMSTFLDSLKWDSNGLVTAIVQVS